MRKPSWLQGIWQLRAMLRPQAVPPCILAITSACAKEGKTLITASLGQVLSLDKWRVLLLDLSFQDPRLGDLWQLPHGPGISEVLLGRNSLTECVHTVGSGELSVIPNGRADGRPLGYWDPAALAAILPPLKSGYDFILLDLPAIAGGEGALFTKLADLTLMVIAAGQTPQNLVSRGLQQIERSGGRVAGLVLNNIPPAPGWLSDWWARLPMIRDQWPSWQERFRRRGFNMVALPSKNRTGLGLLKGIFKKKTG